MNKRIKILTIVIILLGLVYGQRTIIHAGTLLDGKSKRVLKKIHKRVKILIKKSLMLGY